MKNWSKSILGLLTLSLSLGLFTSCEQSIIDEYENSSNDQYSAMKNSVYSDDVKCTVTTESPTHGTVEEKGTRCFFSDKQNCAPTTQCNTDASFVNLVNSYYTEEQWYEDMVNGVPYTEPEIIAYIDAHFRE